jgi:hypothetical protein
VSEEGRHKKRDELVKEEEKEGIEKGNHHKRKTENK